MVNHPPKVLALIPARGGSKSIPQKNIKRFGNHPLIAYSIAAGQQATIVDRVIVSTDDDTIAGIAQLYGAEVPFMRPWDLALDHVKDYPVFVHALEWLAEHEDYHPDVVVQLRPTSPLRPLGCVDEAVAQLLENPVADCVRTVTPSWQNPYKMWRLAQDAMIPLLNGEFKEPYNMPRQELPDTFWQTGHIDVIRTSTIFEKQSLSGEVILPYVIDSGYALDIDTPEDWEIADWALRHRDIEFITPSLLPAKMKEVKLVVMGFDGVFTDARVYVSADNSELVMCNRGDGMGIAQLKAQGVELLVLSEEANPLMKARCHKLKLDSFENVTDKAAFVRQQAEARGLALSDVVYVGCNPSDLECLQQVGVGIVVADASPRMLAKAEWVLSNRGGQGAVREVTDLILSKIETH